MDYWNWNFDLENKSVYHNAWLWTYDSNQWNNDIYGKNVVISNIVRNLMWPKLENAVKEKRKKCSNLVQ